MAELRSAAPISTTTTTPRETPRETPRDSTAPIEQGVLFPANPEGKRSSMAAGVAIWAAAAEAADPTLAAAIRGERNFRANYAQHLVALAEVCNASDAKALAVAQAGLSAISGAFEFVRDGKSSTMADAMKAPSEPRVIRSARIEGTGTPLDALEVPYLRKQLTGNQLWAQARDWMAYGCMAEGAEKAIRAVAETPAWLDLRGRCFLVLGASSALGPLRTLLQCGATVLAVARGRADTWRDLIGFTRGTAGTLLVPVRGDAPTDETDESLAGRAGADLMVEAPEIAAWAMAEAAVLGLPLTVGAYTYLDSDAHVRVNVACDAIVQHLVAASSSGSLPVQLSLAYLQTPSIVYAIPQSDHSSSTELFHRTMLKYLGYPPNARPPVTTDAGKQRYVHDGLLNLQGPNYALAKTMQLWRAILARNRDGIPTSMNIAPAARTASMVAGNNKNAASIKYALDGMGYFVPMVAFNADTVAATMAGLLIYDLQCEASVSNPKTPLEHPWDLASLQAFHGGAFRIGIKPEALGKLQYVSGRLMGRAKMPAFWA